MQNHLAEFRLFLVQKGNKPATVYRQLVSARVLIEAVGLPITASKLTGFLVSLKGNGRKGTYLNHFIDLCRVWNQCFNLPQFDIKYFKKEEFVKATMSDEEIEAFLALPCRSFTVSYRGKPYVRRTDPELHRRMTLFWSICAFTGARMGEVANLCVDNVDFGRKVFILTDTKTKDFRLVPIPPNIEGDVKAYVAGVDKYLFPSRRGGNKFGKSVVDNVDWQYDFKKRLQQMGLRRTNLTPYSLRHSFITSLLEQDIAFPKVMKIAGHSNPKTTMAYTHLTTKDIQEAVKKLPLIRKSTDPKHILQSFSELIESFQLYEDDRFSYSFTQTESKLSVEVGIR